MSISYPRGTVNPGLLSRDKPPERTARPSIGAGADNKLFQAVYSTSRGARIKEGWLLRKHGQRVNYKRRYFILWENKELVSYKTIPYNDRSAHEDIVRVSPSGVLYLLADRGHPFVFEMRPSADSLPTRFATKSMEDREIWVAPLLKMGFRYYTRVRDRWIEAESARAMIQEDQAFFIATKFTTVDYYSSPFPYTLVSLLEEAYEIPDDGDMAITEEEKEFYGWESESEGGRPSRSRSNSRTSRGSRQSSVSTVAETPRRQSRLTLRPREGRLYEDFQMKASGGRIKKYRLRWLILWNRREISWFEDRPYNDRSLPRGKRVLTNDDLVGAFDGIGQKFCWEVRCKERSYQFGARNEVEREEWIRSLASVGLKRFDNGFIPKQVDYRGVEKPDWDAFDDDDEEFSEQIPSDEDRQRDVWSSGGSRNTSPGTRSVQIHSQSPVPIDQLDELDSITWSRRRSRTGGRPLISSPSRSPARPPPGRPSGPRRISASRNSSISSCSPTPRRRQNSNSGGALSASPRRPSKSNFYDNNKYHRGSGMHHTHSTVGFSTGYAAQSPTYNNPTNLAPSPFFSIFRSSSSPNLLDVSIRKRPPPPSGSAPRRKQSLSPDHYQDEQQSPPSIEKHSPPSGVSSLLSSVFGAFSSRKSSTKTSPTPPSRMVSASPPSISNLLDGRASIGDLDIISTSATSTATTTGTSPSVIPHHHIFTTSAPRSASITTVSPTFATTTIFSTSSSHTSRDVITSSDPDNYSQMTHPAIEISTPSHASRATLVAPVPFSPTRPRVASAPPTPSSFSSFSSFSFTVPSSSSSFVSAFTFSSASSSSSSTASSSSSSVLVSPSTPTRCSASSFDSEQSDTSTKPQRAHLHSIDASTMLPSLATSSIDTNTDGGVVSTTAPPQLATLTTTTTTATIVVETPSTTVTTITTTTTAAPAPALTSTLTPASITTATTVIDSATSTSPPPSPSSSMFAVGPLSPTSPHHSVWHSRRLRRTTSPAPPDTTLLSPLVQTDGVATAATNNAPTSSAAATTTSSITTSSPVVTQSRVSRSPPGRRPPPPPLASSPLSSSVISASPTVVSPESDRSRENLSRSPGEPPSREPPPPPRRRLPVTTVVSSDEKRFMRALKSAPPPPNRRPPEPNRGSRIRGPPPPPPRRRVPVLERLSNTWGSQRTLSVEPPPNIDSSLFTTRTTALGTFSYPRPSVNPQKARTIDGLAGMHDAGNNRDSDDNDDDDENDGSSSDDEEFRVSDLLLATTPAAVPVPLELLDWSSDEEEQIRVRRATMADPAWNMYRQETKELAVPEQEPSPNRDVTVSHHRRQQSMQRERQRVEQRRQEARQIEHARAVRNQVIQQQRIRRDTAMLELRQYGDSSISSTKSENEVKSPLEYVQEHKYSNVGKNANSRRKNDSGLFDNTTNVASLSPSPSTRTLYRESSKRSLSSRASLSHCSGEWESLPDLSLHKYTHARGSQLLLRQDSHGEKT